MNKLGIEQIIELLKSCHTYEANCDKCFYKMYEDCCCDFLISDVIDSLEEIKNKLSNYINGDKNG